MGANASAPANATRAAPAVSVIIPAFNGAEVIGLTLDSLDRQSHRDFEWVVVDDASTDGTADVVSARLSHGDGRGRLVRNDRNLGLARTLNRGLREVAGEYVLVLHQDIVLLSDRWIETAARDLDGSPAVGVVTGYYGIPAPGETGWAQRVFGVLRRQFHWPRSTAPELVTFSEFKCDLVRRSALDAIGGFPERFRIAGEDLWISYSLQERGARILKDFDLRCVQRFTGPATTVGGNLRKEFLFGKVIAGTLVRFRGRVAKGLGSTPYSRSRSLNRASQPLVLLAIVLLGIAGAATHAWFLWAALAALVGGRLAYYFVRLEPGIARITGSRVRAIAESLAGTILGLGSDVAYTAGLLVGLVAWGRGSTV
jgi:glycosyltransferase involved in cell wall biosynthesis